MKPPTSRAPSTSPAMTKKTSNIKVPPFISKPMAKRNAQIRPAIANKFISFSWLGCPPVPGRQPDPIYIVICPYFSSFFMKKSYAATWPGAHLFFICHFKNGETAASDFSSISALLPWITDLDSAKNLKRRRFFLYRRERDPVNLLYFIPKMGRLDLRIFSGFTAATCLGRSWFYYRHNTRSGVSCFGFFKM